MAQIEFYEYKHFKNISIIKRFKAAVRLDFEHTKFPQTLQRT